LQHNKVLIAKRNGSPVKILFGSTNFSFRGLYIQANNALVFHAPEAAALFETLFELAFTNPKSFETNSISTQWHTLQLEGKPPIQFAFSPHSDSNLALNSVAAAIDQAKSSVFFSIAFLNQDKSGPVREAINRLMTKSLFSYGISDKVGGLEVRKPDGSVGIADFAFLAKNAPEPFKSEWAGGSGIHEHHKFVVTDFSLPAAKVLTGSSNMASTGEKDNGDNMVLIQDQKVATSYAIEALRTFDHLQFRSRLQAATSKDGSADTLTLKKPKKQSGQPAWFEGSYVKGSQVESDRKLFSH
jgi:phosphatidylserine/phosphatidylglycerophosphate/cardiolipin synthase-like enzyme